MKYEKKRALLKLISSTLTIPLFGNLHATTKTKKTYKIYLLDIRNSAGNMRFQNELQREFASKWKPTEQLNIVNIDLATQTNPIKLNEAINAGRDSAYVTVGKRATHAAMAQPNSIPIIFSTTEDPFTNGILNTKSTQRVITGYTSYAKTNTKRWEILKEAFPKIKKIIVLAAKNWPHLDELKKEARSVANVLGSIEIVEIDVDLDVVMQIKAALTQKQIGVDIPHTPITARSAKSIIDCVNEIGMPAIYDGDHYVKLGGLLGYEAAPLDAAKTTIELLSLVINGLSPQQTTIRYPTSFTFAINLKTANQLGFTIKKSLLVRADLVVEK